MKRAALILACALLAGCATSAEAPAPPVAVLTQDAVTVALYRQPCALPAVANLPHRATWHEPSRGHFEGCFAVQHGTVVVLYFEDRTVLITGLSNFRAPGAPRSSPLSHHGV